jgi:cytochrome c553
MRRMKNTSFQTAVLVVAAMLVGGVLDRAWLNGIIPTASAQEGRAGAPAAPPKPMTPAEMQTEIERLKTLVPSYSHPMQDVAINWASLWFAAQKKNWPLARYFYNEARSHIAWTVRINPNDKVNGEIVDLKSIYDAIDTSSLMMVKDAIDKQNSAQFTAAYKTMLESCYSCHKAAGKPMIRPQIPAAPILTIVNNDPAASWPD